MAYKRIRIISATLQIRETLDYVLYDTPPRVRIRTHTTKRIHQECTWDFGMRAGLPGDLREYFPEYTRIYCGFMS